VIVVRSGPVSFRAGRRPLAVTASLSAVALAALVAGVALGEFAVPPLDVLASLAGAGDPAVDFIVLDLRLPRVLTALLAGAALAMAGAVFQQVARNPLVAPDIVGVSGGASLAAVAVIVFGVGFPVPLAALAGALVSGAALYALAWRNGVQGQRFVLVGIGAAALAQAGIGYVLTEGRIFEVAQAYVWLVGSVNGRGWEQVWPLALTLAILAPALVALARRADVLELGDDLARALGVGVERSRLALLAAAVALTGVAVAAAGPVGFVAFVAPHLARRLGRPASLQSLLPLAAACGAALVVVCDLAGRLLFAPTEIPVGLLTSIVAAPYFLLLLRRAA
jgi:iron complex transport system permease protein